TYKVVLIKEKLKAVRDSQKSYADKRRKPLEFEVGDQVLLKVSPSKGVVHFRKKGKLTPRYVGSFKILERIGLVAYRLRLPEELSSVHDTFYVSNMKKCLVDVNLHVPLDEIKVDKTLHFVEKPVEIMDREIKKLKHRRIALVKVRWNSKRGPEFTWEHEDQMRIKYPQLFAMIDQGVTAALAARDVNRNGDDNHTSGMGTEGVVELTQWFERMETVFRISNCSMENKIKFSTCTLLAGALTWWNSHVRIVGHDVAMFPEESDKVKRYVGGFPDMIHGSVVASKPKTMKEATEMATELMDKKISTFAERQAENKRKLDNNHQAQQQLPKRQNVVQAYATGDWLK
ncbi:hypothetical protein Tco_1549642, partial [Tanacetum coccineum]